MVHLYRICLLTVLVFQRRVDTERVPKLYQKLAVFTFQLLVLIPQPPKLLSAGTV